MVGRTSGDAEGVNDESRVIAKTYLAYACFLFVACDAEGCSVQCFTVHGLCYQFTAVVLVMEGQCIQKGANGGCMGMYAEVCCGENLHSHVVAFPAYCVVAIRVTLACWADDEGACGACATCKGGAM